MNMSPVQTQRPLKTRIMRNITVLVGVAFLVITIFALLVVRSFNQSDLEFVQQVTLSEGVNRLENITDPIYADLTQIAASNSVQSFALETVSLSGEDADLQSAQAGVIGLFSDLIERGRGTYLSARYIMRTGSVWTEVTWENGQVAVNDDFSLRVLNPEVAPQLVAGLATEFGSVVLANYSVTELPDGTIQPTVSLITPITRPNDLNSVLGIIELEMDATRLLTSLDFVVEETSFAANQRLLVVNNDGQVLADTAQPSLAYLVQQDPILGEELQAFLSQNSGEVTYERVGQFNNAAFISAMPLDSINIGGQANWRLVAVTDAGGAVANTARIGFFIVLANLLGAALIIVVLNRNLNQNLRPISAVGAFIQQLATPTEEEAMLAPAARPASALEVPEDSQDEDVQMAQAAQQLALRLQALNHQIDQQTERYNRNLKVAARIGRETALLEDLDELLNRAINLICTSFGLYHAQVFLVDEAGVNAVLRYSRGEAGRKLLAQGHKLPVGSKSVIGRVTATGQPVIVNDTVSGASGGTHAFNPLLANTRAEMALPLQIGDIVLGALDLQSDQPGSFREEDEQTYQLIADQIAVAIYKTRLLRQTEDRVDEIETLNRRLTQLAWEELEQEVGLEHAYRYNLLEVEEGGIEDSGLRFQTTQLMSIPITIRGEVIGTIHAAPPEDIEFTDGDHTILQSVAERVALAVENARLFQKTQTNLAETSTLYETSRSLNEADEMTDIIAAMIQTAMPGATGGVIGIFDDYLATTSPAVMEIIANWFAGEAQMTPDFNGRRYDIPAHKFLAELNSDQVTLVENTLQDQRIDGAVADLFQQAGAGAAVFIPLTVRGTWRGAIGVFYPQPRQFREREGRIYNNLIDQAGVAIDNRLLLRQTENALSQNERLYAGSRMINQAQGLDDLVRAAAVTTEYQHLNFGLALFEGDLDQKGWSTLLRHVAQSRNGGIYEPNHIYEISVNEQSALLEREPVVIDVNTAAPGTMEATLADIAQSNGDTYSTVFPLFSVNQAIALFFVSRKTNTPLTDEDDEIYRALTGQMSTVIQNRRLLEQTATALDETRRLYEATRVITDARDMDEMYAAALRYISMPTPSLSRLALLLAEPDPTRDADALRVAFSWSRSEEQLPAIAIGTRFENNQAPFGMLGEEIMLVEDLQSELAAYPQLQAFFAEGDVQTVLIGALETRQNWFGVLVLESEQSMAFEDSYVRFIDALTDQLAIALENQRLFEAAQQEARQALALAEAGQLANQVGGELTEAVDMLFARVAGTAGYDRWLLVLLENNRLNIVTENFPEGVPNLLASNVYLGTLEHSIADAIRVNRMLLINSPSDYPAYKSKPRMAKSVGKHIATPIVIGGEVAGGLIVGRSLSDPDMADRDETLVSTLAAQIAVSVENQRLFLTAEAERGTLRSILETLPAGVLVLDANTLKPIQYNAPMAEYMGREIDDNLPFDATNYDLYRTGTNLHYPNDELPIILVKQTGAPAFSDDVSVITEDGHQTDLLINAAPIRDAQGQVVNIVAAFEDISNLRSLENTLQDNLRETISLYEATRTLSQAEDLSDVLDVVLFQLIMMEPGDAYVLLMNTDGTALELSRFMNQEIDINQLPVSVLNSERQVMINDVSTNGMLTDDETQGLLVNNIAAIASVPLAASQRAVPLGWMLVTYPAPHEFTPEQERFLSTLGDNAAVAIDNRYLFYSTQDALQETSFLYNATTHISRASDMDELGEVISDALESLSPDIYAAYLMSDPSSPDTLDELFYVGPGGTHIPFDQFLMEYGLFREEAIYIDDLYNLPEPTPFEQVLRNTGQIAAFASVSLRVKGMPDGRLFLGYQEPRTFSEGDSRYLNAIADSASVVVDNIILLAQIKNALEETSTLYQASRSLADATSTDDIMDVVVEKLIGEHVTQVFVVLLMKSNWSDPGASVEVVSSWQSEGGVDLSGVSLTSEQFPAWNKLATSTVLTLDDVRAAPNLSDMERMGIESLDTRALTIIPLRVPSRAIGAIWIGSQEPHTHTESEKRVLQAFAEQASLSLEASFLLEQTEKRARQLATSSEVSQIASSILDLNELMPQVVDLIQEQFGYDHVQIFLMDDAGEYAELRASTGEAGQQLLSINHKLAKGSQSVIGQVTQNAEPEIALDTSDARVVHRPNPYLPLTRSEMALPITIKREVIGALDVQSNEPNAFDQDDIAVLRTLAAQLSVAIDNARLFDQAESRADEMSFLFTITTAAASADTLEEALQNVVDLLRGALNTLSVGVYLLQQEIESPLDEFKPKLGQQQDTADVAAYLQIVSLSGSDQPLSEVEDVEVGDPDNLIGVVAQNLVPIIVDDIRQEPRYLPLVSGARSAVIVPQSTSGEIVGLIVMESEKVGEYDQDTLTLLLALSGTLAAIVQNAQLIDQILQTNEELKTLDRLKSDFLANMSHELRTPLNSIIGFSRVMLKGIDGPLTSVQEEDLTTIYNSGQHLLGLINDILDSAKIAADKMDLQEAYFDMQQVAEGVRSIGIGLVKEKPVDIRLEVANNLPQGFGDEFRTRQVLLNLVSNSAKFTSEGHVTISVYTQQIAGQLMVRVDVSDTGIGIAEKDLPALFEAFRQVDSSLTRTAEGTGLGLPIAKSLVELQGGEMFVESELNVGSTFSITVPTQPTEVILNEDGEVIDSYPVAEPDTEDGSPATPAEAADTIDTEKPEPTNGATQPPQKASPGGPPAGIFQQKRQILLIEDNPDMVDQFRRQLQREGFEVQVANHPMFAETMASGLRPTLIIMDVLFAEGQGWAILEKIKDRDDTFDIPVIVVTMNDESERAYQMGAYDFIQRPYTPDALLESVLRAEQESNVDRILIIDDQEKDTRLVEQLLQEHGKYRVFAAHTGPEGISLVARRRPDLIILDLRMPQMDGFAVLEELRRQPEIASIPVVVVTGETTLSEDEKEQLANLEIIYKTDLNQDRYQHFIDEVKRQIARYHGEQ